MGKYKSKDKLPPGTVRPAAGGFIPAKPLQIYIYDTENIETFAVPVNDLADFKIPANKTVWLHCPHTSNPEALQAIGDKFNIDSLVLEDIQNTSHRPKMEDYADYNFIIQKEFSWDNEKSKVKINHLAYLFFKSMVITFAESNSFQIIADRLFNKKGKIRQKGADYLLFCLLDIICDDYFQTMNEIETLLETYEDDGHDEESAPPGPAPIFRLKKEAVILRRNLRPLIEAVEALKRSSAPPILTINLTFYRDLSDHLAHLLDSLDMVMVSADNLISLSLNMAGQQTNRIMKVLTIIATIFIPLTFIAGVYGMNFAFMPELKLPWGYPAALGLMVLIGIIMLIIFKRKKWF